MFEIAIPQSAITGFTCAYISCVISAFFSNNSWKVNTATVFLINPPVILMSADSKLSTLY